jgi:hypothetical protein
MNPYVSDPVEQQTRPSGCHRTLHLYDWLRDIFPRLSGYQKDVWVELMVLANASFGYGRQVNYLSTDQIAVLLDIDQQALPGILYLAQQFGKIEITNKAVVPFTALGKELVSSASLESASKGGEITCARYESMLFPGMYWYRDLAVSYRPEFPRQASLDEKELNIFSSLMLEASELLRKHDWSTTYPVLSEELFGKTPICSSKIEELPRWVFLYDGALGELDAAVLGTLDHGMSMWNLGPRETADVLQWSRRKLIGKLLERPSILQEAATYPSHSPVLSQHIKSTGMMQLPQITNEEDPYESQTAE